MINQINRIYDIENYSHERKRRVAERIEELRRATINPETEKTYTQGQLAEELGYSLLTYKGWTGKAKKDSITMPTINQLADMADFFGCDIGYLLCEDGYEKGGIVSTDICRETGLTPRAVGILRKDTYKDTAPFISLFIEHSHDIIRAVEDEVKLAGLAKIWKGCPDYPVVLDCFKHGESNARKRGSVINVYYGDTASLITEDAVNLYYQYDYEEDWCIGYHEDGTRNEENLRRVLGYVLELAKQKERYFTIQETFLGVVKEYISNELKGEEK